MIILKYCMSDPEIIYQTWRYISGSEILSRGSKIIMSDLEIIMFLCVYLGVQGTMSDSEIPLYIISGSDIVPWGPR